MSDFIISNGETYISSRANPVIAEISSLKDAKGRREKGLFIAEGIKLAREAAQAAQRSSVSDSDKFKIRYAAVFSDAAEKNPEIISSARELANAGAKLLVLSAPAFDKIATEKSPQGIVVVCEIPVGKRATDCKSLILDTIQDPGNLGTIIRSAAALGWNNVILSGCADPYSTKVLRASMGAVLRVNIFVSEEIHRDISFLKKSGHRIVKADIGEDCSLLGEDNVFSTDCLVIGNEGHGISPLIESLCDAGVTIPMKSGVESLNAAVSASIIMWEYSKL